MLAQFNSLVQLMQAFPDDKSCLNYLRTIVWKNKTTCPHCGHDKSYYISRLKRCKCANKDCQKQFTILKGTIFENSNIPLTKWFIAIYLSTSNKKGISSIQLGKYIDVTTKTAWFMLHRIRETQIQDCNVELKGTVECDETYIGGKRRGAQRGRSLEYKIPVFGMIERGGELRACIVPNCKSITLHPIITKTIRKGSKLMTDEFRAYRGLSTIYHHQVICHCEKIYAQGEVYTNTIEGFWSWLKRALKSTHHWVSKKHLHRYLDEFVFKYNLRKFTDSNRFIGVLNRCSIRLTYKQLIHGQTT